MRRDENGPRASARHRGEGRRALAALALAASLAIAGCGGKKDAFEAENIAPPAPTTAPVLAQGSVEVAPPGEFHLGVGMRARAEGNRVMVTLQNSREDALPIRPQDFGVITGGQLHRVAPVAVDFRLFQPTRLLPGATYTGALQFRELGDLAGARLVFNSPILGEPFYVIIEPSGAAAPAAP